MKPKAKGQGCSNCEALQLTVEKERARVDKLTEIVFALSAHKITGSATVPHLHQTEEPVVVMPEPVPEKVMRAILERSDPNSPQRRELLTRAREMLDAGVGAGDVEERIRVGEELDL